MTTLYLSSFHCIGMCDLNKTKEYISSSFFNTFLITQISVENPNNSYECFIYFIM